MHLHGLLCRSHVVGEKMIVIEPSVVVALGRWLGEDGKKFFIDCLNNHGSVSPVIIEDGFPHAVHFREGMQVRNFLRTLPSCSSWTCHDYDNYWTEVVTRAINDL